LNTDSSRDPEKLVALSLENLELMNGEESAHRSNSKTSVKKDLEPILFRLSSRRAQQAGGRVSGRRNSESSRSFIRSSVLAASLLALVVGGRTEGIPEPSLVLYGVVSNLAAGGSRVSFGTLAWVIRPNDGSPAFTVTGVLTNINDQFSYVLRIPCETEIPGVPVSTGALKLAVSDGPDNRAQVTIGGVVASFAQPAQTNLVLTRTDRGRIERVDLTVSLNTGGVLPEAWQLQYFLRTGIDPNDDPDHDGLTNLAEYKAGTVPTDPQSVFELLTVRQDPLGGAFIEWSSVTGKLYTVQRSGELLGGFADLQVHIPATTPKNSFRDTTATGSGPYFYRLRLEE